MATEAMVESATPAEPAECVTPTESAESATPAVSAAPVESAEPAESAVAAAPSTSERTWLGTPMMRLDELLESVVAMKVSELKTALDIVGQPSTGLKAELSSRLIDALTPAKPAQAAAAAAAQASTPARRTATRSMRSAAKPLADDGRPTTEPDASCVPMGQAMDGTATKAGPMTPAAIQLIAHLSSARAAGEPVGRGSVPRQSVRSRRATLEQNATADAVAVAPRMASSPSAPSATLSATPSPSVPAPSCASANATPGAGTPKLRLTRSQK